MRYLSAAVLACWTLVVNADTVNKITVFVSIPPQKFLAERIGGERVRVHAMLQPGLTPETYDPTPKVITRLTTARIYFRIGVPFEQRWMKIITTQNPGMQVVECCAQLMKNGDPHVWTDPDNMKFIAGLIRDTFSARDPDGADLYAGNHVRLVAELEKLDQDIADLLQRRRTNYFIVSHAGWFYYARHYHLEQIALDDYGREKGPRGLAEIVGLARRQGLRTVFIQSGHPTGAAYTLAKELGAQPVMIDNLAENYIENLYRVSRQIAGAVQ